MCPGPFTKQERAEMALAMLINDHLGQFTVTPQEAREFVVKNWARLKVLAHAIHDEAGDGWPKFTPKQMRERGQ